jgi:hypothetical protein
MLTLTLAGLLIGCEPKVKIYDDTGDTTGDDTSDTDTDDTSGDTDTDDTVSDTDPTVQSGTIQCQSSQDSNSYNLYYIDADVSDPQGSGNIATTGSKVYAYSEGGSLIFSDDIIVCTGGSCFGSFREDAYDDLDCDAITDQKFTIEILDKDGNSSGEVKLSALVPEA